MILSFALAFFSTSVTPATPPSTPTHVVFASDTVALGSHQVYVVNDGKVWTAQWDRATNDVTLPYTLFQQTGQPLATDRVTELRVKSVYADETDRVLVVTVDGLMHRYGDNVWDSMWGLPYPVVGSADTFHFPDVEQFAYSQRNKELLYVEDTNGSQFHFGSTGTTSIYATSRDGRRILLGDPWFPADWAREVCVPPSPAGKETVLASIATSGLTVMVVNNRGEVFTRLHEYDTNGGTPFFGFSYTMKDKHKYPGADPLSEFQTRKLPSEDWTQQPAVAAGIVLGRKSQMLQTGKGNAARLLRVVAKDAQGVVGFVQKNLVDAAWQFVPDASLQFDDGDDVRRFAPPAPDRSGVAAYGGAMFHGRQRRSDVVYARTRNFSLWCSPFTLDVTLQTATGTKTVPLEMHTVDAWTVIARDNFNSPAQAQLHGHHPLKVTVQLTAAARKSLTLGEVELLDQLFHVDDETPFRIGLIANQDEIVMVPLSYPFHTESGAWRLVLRSDELHKKSSALSVASTLVHGFGPLETCEELQHAHKHVVALRQQRQADLRKSMLLDGGLQTMLFVADVASVITTTRFWRPEALVLDAFEEHAPALGLLPRLSLSRWLRLTEADHVRTVRTLEARMADVCTDE
jgi:hypothetical protein